LLVSVPRIAVQIMAAMRGLSDGQGGCLVEAFFVLANFRASAAVVAGLQLKTRAFAL
jgi:hypothetical protein